MREILFRGKRTDNGEWVEGLLARYNPTYEVANINLPIYEVLVPVKTKTVGQYTGLTDKNGKKIFEGDIVKGAWKTVFVVYFDTDYLQFRAREISNYANHHDIDFYNGSKGLEVIGNIHDNTELLKGA